MIDSIIEVGIMFPILFSSVESIQLILELIYLNMIEILEVPEQEWQNPPEDFIEDNENCDDQIILDSSIKQINRLFMFINKE